MPEVDDRIRNMGWRTPSLALRITTLVGLAVSAVLVLFTLGILDSLEQHFIEQDLGELQAVADSLRQALHERGAGDDPAQLDQRLMRAVTGHHGVYFSVHDRLGRPHFGTAPEPLAGLAFSTGRLGRLNAGDLQIWEVDGHSYRGALLPMEGDKVLVAVAMDIHLDYLARLHQQLWLGTFIAAAVALLASWAAVRLGHAPLRRLGHRIRGIGSDELHQRLDPIRMPAELEPLMESFNTMLDRLQQSFERLSNFSADIAHELRTPVTNLRTQTQVALSRTRCAAEYREVMYSSLEELERMSRLIGDMLFLAQADHAVATPGAKPVLLVDELHKLFEFFEAWADEKKVELLLTGSAPPLRGDSSMLRRAIGNLLGNALRYTAAGETVAVRLSSSEGQVRIEVENPGADIPAEHLPHLFDRFYRVDASRSHRPGTQSGAEGTGLGLAIVHSIAKAHGGSVAVRSQGGRTCFSLILPQTTIATSSTV